MHIRSCTRAHSGRRSDDTPPLPGGSFCIYAFLPSDRSLQNNHTAPLSFSCRFSIAADYEQTLRMLLDGCRFCEIPLCGVTFRSGGSSSRDTARSNADFTRVHLSLYSSQGMSQRRCEQLLRRHAIPRSVFQKLIGASAPEHRPLFEQWRRKDMRRRIIHWFLTWKYREGRCSIRILGIWLVQGAATCAKSKQSLSERGKEEY